MKNEKIEEMIKKLHTLLSLNDCTNCDGGDKECGECGGYGDISKIELEKNINESLLKAYKQGKKDGTFEQANLITVAYQSKIRKQLLDEIMDLLNAEIYPYSYDLEQEDFDRNDIVNQMIDLIKSKYKNI